MNVWPSLYILTKAPQQRGVDRKKLQVIISLNKLHNRPERLVLSNLSLVREIRLNLKLLYLMSNILSSLIM